MNMNRVWVGYAVGGGTIGVIGGAGHIVRFHNVAHPRRTIHCVVRGMRLGAAIHFGAGVSLAFLTGVTSARDLRHIEAGGYDFAIDMVGRWGELIKGGGKLGAALKRVTDLMHHKKMPLCDPDATFSDVVEQITSGGFGCCGVVENQRLIGIITDGDIRRALKQSIEGVEAKAIMTQNPHTIRGDGLAAEALSMLSEFKITAVFIVNEADEPIGLIHVHDCLAIGVV